MNFPTAIPPGPSPAFVLDVSVAIAWAIPLRYDIYSHRVRSRLAFGAPTVVTTNWPLQLVDELLAAQHRGETTAQRLDVLLANLSAYRIFLDVESPHRAWPEVLDLARAHSISVHGAAYLELALRLNLPLATTDATLVRAAGAAGVPVFAP